MVAKGKVREALGASAPFRGATVGKEFAAATIGDQHLFLIVSIVIEG